MSKWRPTFWIVVAIVFASLIAPLVLQIQARRGLEERTLALRGMEAQLGALTAEHDRLSRRAAESKSSLFDDQFHELMKLRGEIGLLRESAREAARLREAVQKSEASPPDERSILAYWPHGKLSRSGYDNPLSGLQTALWAINQNDPKAVAASLALDFAYVASLRFEGDTLEKQMAAGTKVAFDSIAPASGFYVVGQKLLSEDQVALDIFFEGEGETRPFLMMKKGDNWKLRRIFAAGSPADESAGTRFWP